MKILNKPEIIYLQIDDEIIEDTLDFEELYQISWCSDKINENDISYYSKEFIVEFMNWLLISEYTTSKKDNKELFELFLKEKI